jgi:exodeoxyribonuclease VII small subunit
MSSGNDTSDDYSLPTGTAVTDAVDADATACAGDPAVSDWVPADELSFKQAFDELEDIVRVLEGDSRELEQSLALYERGVSLLRSLKRRLDDASQKVEVLMGELDTADE